MSQALTRAPALFPEGYLRDGAAAILDQLSRDPHLDRKALEDFAGAAFAAHDRAPAAATRYDLRFGLALLEREAAMGGHFAAADLLYRVRLELGRREHRRRWRETREPTALLRTWGYGLWRLTSLYGTSPLRLAWFAFNCVFWFGLLYFIVDYFTVRLTGSRAFAARAVPAAASYLVLGFQGLFPGTAALLPVSLGGQLALAVENAVGAVVLTSLVTLAARRVWRGVA